MDDLKQHPPNSESVDLDHNVPDFLRHETESIHENDPDTSHNSHRELARQREREKAEVRK